MSFQSIWADLFNTLPAIPASELLLLAIALLIAGAAVGFLAGLFGVGGGTVIVPVLYETFGWLGVADDIRMPLCIGTSLAVIIPTSISSFVAHHKRGGVDMDVLRSWLAPVVCGVFLGTLIASYAPGAMFKLLFVLIAIVTAARLIWSDRLPSLGVDLPAGGRMLTYGVTIGASASLVGIGGGILANMVMTLHGRAVHQAVATSAGIGVLVSLPGTLGYVITGWGIAGLLPLSLGFVSIIALLLMMPSSLTTTRIGAAVAHRLSRKHLEYAFAAYLLVVSGRFALASI